MCDSGKTGESPYVVVVVVIAVVITMADEQRCAIPENIANNEPSSLLLPSMTTSDVLWREETL